MNAPHSFPLAGRYMDPWFEAPWQPTDEERAAMEAERDLYEYAMDERAQQLKDDRLTGDRL